MALQATPLKDDHSYFSEGVQTKQTNINQTELKTKTDMVHWSRTELWLVEGQEKCRRDDQHKGKLAMTLQATSLRMIACPILKVYKPNKETKIGLN